MSLSIKELRSIEPIRDDLGEPTESAEEYASRVQRLLPNFPNQVISQWFQEHDGVIEQHASLNYRTLKFELTTLGPAELNLPCLAEHATVVQYRDYFLKGVKTPRMTRLVQFIQEHHTWPVPPLIFDNPDGKFEIRAGFKYSIPYDLLEGHHRMAVLYALQKHNQGRHKVWLIKR